MHAGGHEQKRFRETREIEELVADFESCAVPPGEFDHGAHLAVALWYLSQLPAPLAEARMRAGLHHYTAHHNAGHKYNETVTLFWLKLVRHFLECADASHTLAEHACELVAAYNNPKLVFDYYSLELINRPEARASWVEPDLRPLDF